LLEVGGIGLAQRRTLEPVEAVAIRVAITAGGGDLSTGSVVVDLRT
jgi:hypothetical protein